jgi:hypothetical protein
LSSGHDLDRATNIEVLGDGGLDGGRRPGLGQEMRGHHVEGVQGAEGDHGAGADRRVAGDRQGEVRVQDPEVTAVGKQGVEAGDLDAVGLVDDPAGLQDVGGVLGDALRPSVLRRPRTRADSRRGG